MPKLRDKPNLRQKKSNSDTPATNEPSASTSDVQPQPSVSSQHSSPVVFKQESLGKRVGHGLKGLFRSRTPTPKPAVDGAISSASTRPSAIALPLYEPPQVSPSPPVSTLDSPSGSGVIVCGSMKEAVSAKQSWTNATQEVKLANTILHGAKAVFEVATEASDALPQLKSVLGGIRAIIKVCEVSWCFGLKCNAHTVAEILRQQG